MKPVEFNADVEINDVKNRYILTKSATQLKIKQSAGVDIVTRGKYYPVRSLVTDRDPPLYLHVTAKTQKELDEGLKMINELIEQELPALLEPMDTRKNHRSGLYAKVVVDVEAPTMNLRAKVVGPGGQYVKHIQQVTGTKLQLKGRGSGFIEHSTGKEADEPLFVSIYGQSDQDVDSAKKLCLDLIDTIRKDVDKFKQRMMRPPDIQQYPTAPPYNQFVGRPPRMPYQNYTQPAYPNQYMNQQPSQPGLNQYGNIQLNRPPPPKEDYPSTEIIPPPPPPL